MSAQHDWQEPADDDVITGQVISGNGDNGNDVPAAPTQPTFRPHETYLHKVAASPGRTDDDPDEDDPPGTDLADADADEDEDYGPADEPETGDELEAEAEAEAELEAEAEAELEAEPVSPVTSTTEAEDEDEPVSPVTSAIQAEDMAKGKDEDTSLLGDPAELVEQWRAVAAEFVDDPRASVGAAAQVVADAVGRLEAALRERQQAIRRQWDGNGASDTESLRQAMLVYRRLLDRIVS